MTDREDKKIHGLAVKNLYKSYTIEKTNYEVNKDINLSVPPASLVWIYGNSGAGKSTFLNVITGIDTPDAGSVSWDGSEINTMNVNKRAQFRLEHFGLIFQFFELIKAQTIYENAALPLKITRKSKKKLMRYCFRCSNILMCSLSFVKNRINFQAEKNSGCLLSVHFLPIRAILSQMKLPLRLIQNVPIRYTGIYAVI